MCALPRVVVLRIVSSETVSVSGAPTTGCGVSVAMSGKISRTSRVALTYAAPSTATATASSSAAAPLTGGAAGGSIGFPGGGSRGAARAPTGSAGSPGGGSLSVTPPVGAAGTGGGPPVTWPESPSDALAAMAPWKTTPPVSSSWPRMSFTATTSPSARVRTASTPDLSAGTSTVILSVSSSTRVSPAMTASPSCFSQRDTVALTIDSPRGGTMIAITLAGSCAIGVRENVPGSPMQRDPGVSWLNSHIAAR